MCNVITGNINEQRSILSYISNSNEFVLSQVRSVRYKRDALASWRFPFVFVPLFRTSLVQYARTCIYLLTGIIGVSSSREKRYENSREFNDLDIYNHA